MTSKELKAFLAATFPNLLLLSMGQCKDGENRDALYLNYDNPMPRWARNVPDWKPHPESGEKNLLLTIRYDVDEVLGIIPFGEPTLYPCTKGNLLAMITREVQWKINEAEHRLAVYRAGMASISAQPLKDK